MKKQAEIVDYKFTGESFSNKSSKESDSLSDSLLFANSTNNNSNNNIISNVNQDNLNIPDFLVFRNEIDSWVKQMNGDLTEVQLQMLDIPKVIEEHECNINHNYELVIELKKTIDDLKAEIRELKMMQLISLKSRSLKEIKYE